MRRAPHRIDNSVDNRPIFYRIKVAVTIVGNTQQAIQGEVCASVFSLQIYGRYHTQTLLGRYRELDNMPTIDINSAPGRKYRGTDYHPCCKGGSSQSVVSPPIDPP